MHRYEAKTQTFPPTLTALEKKIKEKIQSKTQFYLK
jgi:hypothetical protein